MQEAIKTTDPRRWENYQRRRGDMDASHEPAAGAEELAYGGRHARSGRGDEEDGAPSGPSPSAPRIPESELIHRLCSVDVAEVFSPPRVSSEAAKFGLMAGEAMDLTTGWDFNRKEDRGKAEEYVDKVKPLVLIGSPPCVAFSQLQSLIADSERKREQLREGIRHKEFVAKL